MKSAQVESLIKLLDDFEVIIFVITPNVTDFLLPATSKLQLKEFDVPNQQTEYPDLKPFQFIEHLQLNIKISNGKMMHYIWQKKFTLKN